MNATFIFHKEKYLDAALTHKLQFFLISLKFDKMIINNPRQNSWNTCVRFPFPRVDLGISMVPVLQYAWLNIGEGEGTLQWEQKCEE